MAFVLTQELRLVLSVESGYPTLNWSAWSWIHASYSRHPSRMGRATASRGQRDIQPGQFVILGTEGEMSAYR